MKRPNREDILEEFNNENKVAYGSYIENEYHKQLEVYVDWMEQQSKLFGVGINEVALPINTEVIFEGKQRFITKYCEYNNKLAYRLNGSENTEIFLKSDFDEIL